ncbi:hypothetical protein ACJIZ3_007414 [Penstemon smallii]|uniref:Uncharacterized protein n=1 Tax=Penstemon smallii TaxID=265156 RepID=A0ABD3SAG0_9LAMI
MILFSITFLCQTYNTQGEDGAGSPPPAGLGTSTPGLGKRVSSPPGT